MWGVFLSLNYKAITFIKCWQSREKTSYTKVQVFSPILYQNSLKFVEKKMKQSTFFLFSVSFARSTAHVLQFSPEPMLHCPSFPVSAQPSMHPSFPAIPNTMDPHNVAPNQSCSCWWSHLQTQNTLKCWALFFPSLWKRFLLRAIWQEIHKVICNRKIMD